ncbi:MAG: carboxypeptidase-like regulatory domain-containing protein [Bryobacteraceae bacterium]|nr:carboxypeptidase-like regulatory domain-containing protein [Bryobacteraceae bacterium]MDW8378302.1 carboxypeptidase-like regulatory domain-containing protein [Bryobacterales bacterium]
MWRSLYVGILAWQFAGALLAQVATLTGRVLDPSGAVVPGASITARSLATGISVTAETTSEGYYTIPALPPGRYELAVSKAGFTPVRQSGIELAVQQVARVDFTLRVGAVNETVEVHGQAPLLESESATLGQVIGNRQVTELPLLGRNTYALAMLVPGVRPSAGVNNLVIDQISTVAYSINGQRASANEFLLDGAPNSAAAQNQPVVNANPDMVQEFKVETNNFSAEFGRAAGGVFNVVTRSGTNELHFSLYEFLRNDKLNANDFFANRSGVPRAPFRFNQFGGSVGGPVVIPRLYNGKNRTFFFANTEIVRFIQGITFTAVLPDPRHLTGDFSQARLSDGRVVTIFDPATTTASPAGGFVRSAFPGNVIPASRIDPVARNVARFLPSPTIPGQPLGVINYTRTDGNRVPKDSYSFRGDHHLSSAHRMFVRYSYDDTPFLRAPAYGREFRNVAPTAGPQVFTRWNAILEDTYAFSPSLLGVFRYSATRLINFRRPYSDNFDIESLGLPAYLRSGMVDPVSFPAISITGYSISGSLPNIVVGGLLGATDLIRFGNTLQSVQGNLTKNLTKHTLKFGGEFRVIQFNNHQVGDQATNFTFSPVWTQGPNPTVSSAVAGLGLATFLLGIPGGGVNPAPALALTNRYHALFVQDAWRLTPKLTLNWGLRWDYETPRTERFNQLTNFDFNAPSPLQAPGLSLRGGLTFVGVDGRPRYQANPDRNNFAPRLGLAYKVTSNTVIRLGGGLFYAGLTGVGGGAGPFGASGFQAATSIVTSLDGVTPIVKWSDPYPNGFNWPTGSRLGLATLLGQSIQFYDRGNVVPYSSQWNLSIQRQFWGNFLVDVGYAGSRGISFPENRQFNQLSPEFLALGDALRQQVTNPFFGQIAVGPLSQRTVARAQLLRPFPHFDAVSSQSAGWASSSYHALEAKLEKRFASGLSWLVSYTYSKLLDFAPGGFAGEALGASVFQNWSNLAAERSVSTIDQTHRYIANAVYELPFFARSTGAVGKLFGGWQMGGIWMWFSGGPLGVTSAVNNTFSQGGGQRPNWSGLTPCVSDPTPQRWLDSSVFSVPPPYAFGNAPRTFGGCRSDITSQLDLTLTKNTRFRERFNLQFRTEIFNLTNTVRFAPPNQNFGNPQFGVVNSQGNQPRIIQFALKLVY